jgi:hypothetical protein
MEPIKRIKRQRINTEHKKVDTFGAPAGLARTHRLIRVERDLEIQFIKVCSKIKLNDYRKARSESQRDERLSKRHVG